MVSLSAKSSINLLNLKANVRVKIVLSVLNGLVLCLLTKMANVFAFALSLVLPLNLAAIVYTYPDDFRSFPGLSRNSQEFFDLYNKRVARGADYLSPKILYWLRCHLYL